MSLSAQLQKLNGAVIVIASRRKGYGGCIVALSHHTAEIGPMEEDEKKKKGSVPWMGQWILHHIKDDIIVLESVRFRDRYLNMTEQKNGNGFYRLPKLTKFPVKPWNSLADSFWPTCMFKVWGSTFDNVAFQSYRWPILWLDAHHYGHLYGTRKQGPSTEMIGESWGGCYRFKILPSPARTLRMQVRCGGGQARDQHWGLGGLV